MDKSITNPIDKIFSENKDLKLMTHVVGGYPDLETSEQLIEVMAESGADLVEIQIPFSDPLADGPTIATANQASLDKGTRPIDCFELANRLSQRVHIPLLFMTYANIPYCMGVEKFIQKSIDAGVSGLIVPDLPFDQYPQFYEMANQSGCYAIPVVSPGMNPDRLEEIVKGAKGFIYTTLRVGITGVRKQINDQGLKFLEILKTISSIPIAAGFGISSPEMVKQLENHADAAVIGSHVINLFNQKGIQEVAQFIWNCKERLKI